MKIKEIYIELALPENLQNHMLWVAGLAKVIFDNWQGPQLNEKDLMEACLFHDIAKVLSFSQIDDASEKSFKIISEIYGKDEHEACNKIAKYYLLSPRAVEILNNNNISPFIEKARYVLNSEDYEHKIMRYADSRVSKTGVVTLEERTKEFFARNPGRTPDSEAEEINIKSEKQIQEYCQLRLTEIKHGDCEKHKEELLDLEV